MFPKLAVLSEFFFFLIKKHRVNDAIEQAREKKLVRICGKDS